MTDSREPIPPYVIEFLDAVNRLAAAAARQGRALTAEATIGASFGIEASATLKRAIDGEHADVVVCTDTSEIELVRTGPLASAGVTPELVAKVKKWARRVGITAAFFGQEGGPLGDAGKVTLAAVLELWGQIVEWMNQL